MIVDKHKGSLLKRMSLVSFMTILSRVLGFCRDVIMAQVFGASGTYDAFLLAFKIPNFMRRLFAEGAFSQAFVPVLAEYKAKSFCELQSFVRSTGSCLAVILICFVLVGSLCPNLIINLFAPGFAVGDSRLNLAVELLRITLPYILFISLTSFSASILHSFNRFGLPAITPALLNICLIGGAVFYSSQTTTIHVLGIATLIAGFLQFIVQLPSILKLNLLFWPSINWRHPGVKKVLRLIVPALFGVAVGQVNSLLDSAFASFLPAGSISWLYYADRLMEFPLGVIGVAITTVILPKLARHASAAQEVEFSQTTIWALKMILLVGLPAFVGLFCLADIITAALFYRGNFTLDDLEATSSALKAYSFGVIAIMLVKVLASASYAQQKYLTVAKIALAALGVNLLLNSILMPYYAHTGLAIATSISFALNAILLLVFNLRSHYLILRKSQYWLFTKIILLNCLYFMVVYQTAPSLEQFLALASSLRILWLGMYVLSYVALYITLLLGLGFKHQLTSILLFNTARN